MAQKTRFREYMCLLGVRIVKKYGAGVKTPKTPQIWPGIGISHVNENVDYLENGTR